MNIYPQPTEPKLTAEGGEEEEKEEERNFRMMACVLIPRP